MKVTINISSRNTDMRHQLLAALCVVILTVAPTAFANSGESLEQPTLNLTLLSRPQPGETLKVGVHWNGPLPEKVFGWIDADGDGMHSPSENMVLSVTLVEPLTVLELQLPVSASRADLEQIVIRAQSAKFGRPIIASKVNSACTWADDFYVNGIPGNVGAMEVYAGALHVGGPVMAVATTAIEEIGRWDGTVWTSLDDGGLYNIGAMVVFDDGGGPELYVAPDGGTNWVKRWDGSTWNSVGGNFNGQVWALEVYDSGSGPELYAGGTFTQAGFSFVNYIAKLDGSSWRKLGSFVQGANDWVQSLEVYEGQLFAGGFFTSIGGKSANHIAGWNGSYWSTLGTGITGGLQTRVWDLQTHIEGSTPYLYACGDFGTAGGSLARKIARWNGSTWSGVGSGLSVPYRIPYELEVYDDGNGAALFIGGDFDEVGGITAHGIARWKNSTWSALGDGVNASVKSMASYDGKLWIGGSFTTADGASARKIATWDGSNLSAIASGGQGLKAHVHDTVVFDDGSGMAVYASGSFSIDGLNYIAKWNGTEWQTLGSSTDGTIETMASFDDGTGPAMYAGGYFTTAGGTAVSNIARWDGSSWSALGSGVDGRLYDLKVHDDGSGSALYAAGSFTDAGGVTANNIARWDGSSWSALDGGVNSSGSVLGEFDDGSGLALYLGGYFTEAGGSSANRIARWDGSSWSALGSGLNSSALALKGFDDGSGKVLIVGGGFTTAGVSSANRIASWDGSSWSALGSGCSSYVSELEVFDDGLGPILFAGGGFTSAGGNTARRIATWDGTDWSTVGLGFDDMIKSLAVHDTGAGPSLWVGGEFSSNFDTPMSNIGRLSCSCECSHALAAEQWTMIGLGCVPASATIQDIFSDDLNIGSYRSRWVMWDRNEASNSYRRLALSDDLEPGIGYWIYSLDATTLDATGEPVPTACAPSSRFDQCHDTALVGVAAGRENMVSHPFSSPVPWADIIVVDSSGIEYTLVEADEAGIISRVMNKYEYLGGVPPGGHSPYDGETPGMEGTMGEMEGTWVRAFEDATLRIPTATELMSKRLLIGGNELVTERSQPAPLDKSEWYVRVIATGGGMIDRGNVLGEIASASDGQDRHDLEEKPPFGRRYLTVVFPHSWGEYGTFSSDFRTPAIKKHTEWSFQVHSNDLNREVTLSFEGVAEILDRAQLVDELTGQVVPLKTHPTHTFIMGSPIRSFTWRLHNGPK